jgi:hypothetical protein
VSLSQHWCQCVHLVRAALEAHLEVPDGIVDEGCLARAAAELNRMHSFKMCGGRGKPKCACVCCCGWTQECLLCVQMCAVWLRAAAELDRMKRL